MSVLNCECRGRCKCNISSFDCSVTMQNVTLYNCDGVIKFYLPEEVSFRDVAGVVFCTNALPIEFLHASITFDEVTKKVCIVNFSTLTHTIRFKYIIRLCSRKQICVNETILVISPNCVGDYGVQGQQGAIGAQGFFGSQGVQGRGQMGRQGFFGSQGQQGNNGDQQCRRQSAGHIARPLNRR